MSGRGPAVPPTGPDISTSVAVATGSTQARALADRFADRRSVLDFLPAGQPDGTTDNTVLMQLAINTSAGVATLTFPAAAAAYHVAQSPFGGGLVIPSNSHLVIETGATLRSFTSQSMFLIQSGASDILIDLLGTLDGNFPGAGGGSGIANKGFAPCTNVYVDGYGQGQITGFGNNPINIGPCINGEVTGVLMTNSTNSVEFIGNTGIFSMPIIITSGVYSPDVGGTPGYVTLTTAAPHGLSAGASIVLANLTGTGALSLLQGAWATDGTVGGGTSGTTINFKTWPATTWGGNPAPVISGGQVTSRVGQIAGVTGTYNNTNGQVVLTVPGTVPHNIAAGGAFTFVKAAASGALATNQTSLQGEWTATAVSSNTVTYTAASGLGAGSITGGQIGTCVKSSKVGFADCIVERIRDIGLCLYGGCVNSFIRECEVRYCSGPILFSDDGQPGANIDCEISGNYSHDNNGGGPGSAVNTINLKHVNSRVFNNTSCFNLRGGMVIGGADGVDVYDNLIHDNWPGLEAATGQSGQVVLAAGTRGANIRDNTIRNSRQSCTAQPGFAVTSASTYNSGDGSVSLTTAAPHSIAVGDTFQVYNMLGSGQYIALNGLQSATAGTGGNVLNYTAAPGLGPITITSALVAAFVLASPVAISSGTCTNGAVVLNTAKAHGLVAGNPFVVSGLLASSTGPFHYLEGMQVATAGTGGTVINFTSTSGLTATITNGNVLPASFGISLNANDNCRIADNYIIDTQSPALMTAALGGAWGNNGASSGNYYGPRLAAGGGTPGAMPNAADCSIYGATSLQGPSFDPVNMQIYGGSIDGSWQSKSLVNAGTLMVDPDTSFTYVALGGSIATGTIELPLPNPGAPLHPRIEILCPALIGALTVKAPVGYTIQNGPTAVTVASTSFAFVLDGTIWRRRILT